MKVSWNIKIVPLY